MELKSRGIKLGALLVGKGLITQGDLDQALDLQEREGLRLGQALTRSGKVSIDDIVWALADQYEVPYVHLDLKTIDPEAVRLIPEDFARRHSVIPILRCGNELFLAIDDPMKITVLEDVRAMTGLQLNIALALVDEIQKILDEFYGFDVGMGELKPPKFQFFHVSEEDLENIAKDTSGESLIRAILEEAVHEQASLIYIEPQADGVRVRHRVGGLVHLRMTASAGWHPILMTKLRMMAGLHANDGREAASVELKVRLERDEVELMLVLCRTGLGEAAAIKIRNRNRSISLANLGFEENQLTVLRSILSHQLGLIVVTGTSEKDNASTLHALLGEINISDLKAVTVERGQICTSDRYTQLLDEKGENLPQLVDTALLMEPDVLMVEGLIDRQVFSRLLDAALSGQFVMFPQPFERAVDFLDYLISLELSQDITATKLTVIGQRMIKTLCPSCREAFKPDEAQARDLGLEEGVLVYRGKGCDECSGTGYRGQRGVFDMIVMTDSLKEIVRKGQGMKEIRELLAKYGFKSLKQRAIDLLREGKTSLEEVLLIS